MRFARALGHALFFKKPGRRLLAQVLPVLAFSQIFAIIAFASDLRLTHARTCEGAFGPRAVALERRSVDGPVRDVKSEARIQSRVEAILDGFDAETLSGRARVNEIVSKLMIEIYGPRTVLASWLKSKDQRRQKRALDLVRERVLRGGLNALIEMAGPIEKMAVRDRLLAAFFNLKNSKPAAWLGFPLQLPTRANVEFSNELFEKILWEGYDSHSNQFELEAEQVLGRQARIDAYNTFARYYAPVVTMALIGIFFEDNRERNRKEVQSASKKETEIQMQKLEATSRSAESLAQMAPEAIRSAALQRTLTRFRAKYGSDPTPAELAAIKKRIWEKL